MPCSTTKFGGQQEAPAIFTNYSGAVQVHLERMWYPRSLRDLVHVAERAQNEGRRLHAVGSRWSFEAVAASRDWMVDLRSLNRVLEGLTGSMGRRALTPTWRDLTALDRSGRTLETLGGSHGQTLAGALSTGTHGGDLNRAPLADSVEALHLVTTAGRELWVESASSPLTADDAELRRALGLCPELTIVREDELFNAMLVAIGRFGIIYSYVLRTRPAFAAAEVAHRVDWNTIAPVLRRARWESSGTAALSELASSLPAPSASLGDLAPAHYLDFTFATRSAACWVRRRLEARDARPDVGGGAPSLDFCAHGIAQAVLAATVTAMEAYKAAVSPHGLYDPSIPFHRLPLITAKQVELTARAADGSLSSGAALALALNTLWHVEDGRVPVGRHINDIATLAIAEELKSSESGKRAKSWALYAGAGDPEGAIRCYRANSVELVFDARDTRYIDFIEFVRARQGEYRQAGYMAVRYSARSRALLSMHNVAGPVGVAIEVTSLLGLADNDRWLRLLEDEGVRLGGRPHWGQQNRLTRDQVEALYPAEALSAFRRQLARVSGPSETFSNDYTMQRGLEPQQGHMAPTQLWAMRFDQAARNFQHVSPIAGHPFLADIDCERGASQYSGLAVKGMVAADVDGDGAKELVVVPDARGTRGNDLWVMKHGPDGSWNHLSPIGGHGGNADLNCDDGVSTPTAFGVKLVAAGDFDGDGREELVVVPDTGGTAGNDLWVMKFDPQSRTWSHLSPNTSHPFLADINCDESAPTPTRFGVRAVVAGDFDGDGRSELVVVPDLSGTGGNDLWAMKLDPRNQRWNHMSPIASHPFLADINCDGNAPTPTRFGVKAVVAGDFDGDGSDELIVVPDIGGTGGNDLWAMKFDTRTRRWGHMSPNTAHAFHADINCDEHLRTPATFGVKIVIAADFDGDGRDELLVVPDVAGTAGSDFWAMKFDPRTRSWSHLSPNTSHPFHADINCDEGLPVPVAFGTRTIAAADVDADGRAELIVVPQTPGTGGNDLWAMKFDPRTRVWSHVSPDLSHPFRADLNCDSEASRPSRCAVKLVVAGRFSPAERGAILVAAPDLPA